MVPGATSGLLGEPACQKLFRDAWLVTGYKGAKKDKPSDREVLQMAKSHFLHLVKNRVY